MRYEEKGSSIPFSSLGRREARESSHQMSPALPRAQRTTPLPHPPLPSTPPPSDIMGSMSVGGPMAVRPGMSFGGRYTVIRALGEGAMGQVWEARHEALQKRCAIKILAVFPCSDQQERRFVREARALASVDSPFVAQVTDFGHEPGVGLYYVMQFVDGETIEERLSRDQRISVRDVLPIAIDLCAALQDVHDQGVIHRDIKPSNISMPSNGPVRAKLLDFGLAVSLENSFIGRVTTSRTLIGSLAYIAPEVIQDYPLTPSVDLYALGVVLYESLTGRLPFCATTAATFIKECLTASIPPFAEIAPEVDLPVQIEAVVARLLDRDPTQRFASASAAGRALASIATG